MILSVSPNTLLTAVLIASSVSETNAIGLIGGLFNLCKQS